MSESPVGIIYWKTAMHDDEILSKHMKVHQYSFKCAQVWTKSSNGCCLEFKHAKCNIGKFVITLALLEPI